MREQGRSVKWLSEQLCCVRNNVYSIFSRRSIDTELLLELSRILEVDFFKIYSQELNNGGSDAK